MKTIKTAKYIKKIAQYANNKEIEVGEWGALTLSNGIVLEAQISCEVTYDADWDSAAPEIGESGYWDVNIYKIIVLEDQYKYDENGEVIPGTLWAKKGTDIMSLIPENEIERIKDDLARDSEEDAQERRYGV